MHSNLSGSQRAAQAGLFPMFLAEELRFFMAYSLVARVSYSVVHAAFYQDVLTRGLRRFRGFRVWG